MEDHPRRRKILQRLVLTKSIVSLPVTKIFLVTLFCHIVDIIPAQLHSRILNELHITHSGMTRMKSQARSLIYWPNLDKDIEDASKSCKTCLEHLKQPPKFNKHPWEYPFYPWERIHVDNAGPVHNKYLLIVVDAYSTFLQVFVSSSMTSEATCC